jgi:hypothetical protein
MLLLESILYFSHFLVINMRDGSLDVENLKVGDKVANDEECVAMLRVAVIKCEGSDRLEPVMQFSVSKDFKFKDLLLMIDKVRERLAQIEPVKTEQDNRKREIDEYLKKIGFKLEENKRPEK